LSWYTPEPVDAPLRLPRRVPKRVVPSYIGESEQVLNMLIYRGAGDVARDYSDHGNHGNIKGPTWIDGPYGWALSFDGDDDWVDLGDPASLEPTDYMTVLFWFKSTSAQSGAWYDVVRHDGHFNSLQFWSGTGGAGNLFYRRKRLQIRFHVGQLERWGLAFLRVQYSKDSGGELYIDDMTTPLATNSQTGTLDTTTDPWDLGGGTGHHADVDLGTVRIYSSFFSQSDRVKHYEDTKPLYS